ncbi:uS10/mL48 family ribosomal protein [Salinibacter ruber]|uniref:uS10/mL48 family ribosomal protein n=1 Tax=Salinibacter ruber TaxID=146919 RepID=UPI00216920BE|nr:uS10/mL48 family ribosomal protein [Salinibacter ruber]MCS3755575.1 ribosomal protein S10 [Salinibacter ruber]MCS4085541.1 ribosomal protein S10 [Salinibacter ruber]
MTDSPVYSAQDAPNSAEAEGATYLKTCSRCGQLVRMARSDDETWRSLEPAAGGASSQHTHECGSVPRISQDWSLQDLNHPLTCRLDCWWCGEEVYLHTDGSGPFTLFDNLSWPWPTHDCWHQQRDERDRALLKLESDLRAGGYQGQGRLVNLAPSSIPDAIPPKGRKNPPVLQIRLSSTDHQMVDRAVRQITQFVSDRQPRAPVAVPLPVGKKAAADERQGRTNGPPSRDESFSQHIHHRAIEMWTAGPKLVAQLGQVQLPEAVDVTVRQAKS